MPKWLAILMAGAFVLSSSLVFGQATGPVPVGPRPGVYPAPGKPPELPHKKEGESKKEEKPKEKEKKPVPAEGADRQGSPFRDYMNKHNIP
jgi:hypothetical protein